MGPYFQGGRFRWPLKQLQSRPLVMGVLNITPDSFSDGGKFNSLDAAFSRAEQMIAEEVDIIDIGGESSRPGAQPLPLDQELERVMPLVIGLRDCGKALSVDTYKPEVMREALAAGVDFINDIYAFRAPGALDAVRGGTSGLCIMHMQHDPQTMQVDPQYADPVDDVIAFLDQRVRTIEQAGVDRSRICVDPGFGFGKTLQHNLTLLGNLGRVRKSLDLPVLAGLSRKSMIGAITGRPVGQRLAGSLAAALAAKAAGACILRVHDVAETVDALKVWQAAAEVSLHHQE